MKKSSAIAFSPTMELPAITKKFPRHSNRRKVNLQAEKVDSTVPPPSEEVIEQLNRIGQEYPFCVYYKQKGNDPL
jgi:hypothetical protein